MFALERTWLCCVEVPGAGAGGHLFSLLYPGLDFLWPAYYLHFSGNIVGRSTREVIEALYADVCQAGGICRADPLHIDYRATGGACGHAFFGRPVTAWLNGLRGHGGIVGL